MNLLDKETKLNKQTKRKNKIISCILISCLLIELPLSSFGCYTYYSLNESKNNPQEVRSHRYIKFILKDKSAVVASSKDCYFFERDTALFYGIGLLFKGVNMNSSNFEGFINKGEIDSISYSEKTQNPHWLYWLKNNEMLMFEKDKVIDLSESNENKQWLALDANHKSFRVIPFNEVKDIQFQKSSWVVPVIIVAAIVGILIWAASEVHQIFDKKDNSNGHLF